MAIPLTGSNFGREADKFLDGIAAKKIGNLRRAIAIDALEQLIQYTPVDTGRAKGNWVASIGEPSSKYDADLKDSSGETARSTGTALIKQPNWRYKNLWTKDFYITNNTPYIGYLEDGRSKDASLGFMSARTKVYLDAKYYGGATLA